MRPPLDLSIRTLHADAVTARVLACTQHETEHTLRNQFQSLRSGVELLSRAIQPSARTKIDPQQTLELLKGHLVALEASMAALLARPGAGSPSDSVFDAGVAINDLIDSLPPADHALIPMSLTTGHFVRAHVNTFRRSMMALVLQVADCTPPGSAIDIRLDSLPPDELALELRVASIVDDNLCHRLEDACTIVRAALSGSVNRMGVLREAGAFTVSCVFSEVGSPTAGEMTRQSRRVLVVDADKDAADSLAMVLELEGYEASAMYRGDEALSRAEREHFDAVVISPELQDMAGHRLAEEIRNQPRAPVLIAVVDRPRLGAAGKETTLAAFDHLVPNTADLHFLRDVLASIPLLRRD